MSAELEGDLLSPVVRLRFGYEATHAATGELLRDWVKSLPERRWDAASQSWLISGIGPLPGRTLSAAGFTVVGPDGDMADLDLLTLPVAVPHDNDPDGLWELHPRLGGKQLAEEHLEQGTLWSSGTECWLVEPAHLVTDGGSRTLGWVEADPRIHAAARTPVGTPKPNGQLAYDLTLDGLRGVHLTDLHSVKAVSAASMEAVGIDSIHELLHRMPRRYIDMSNPAAVADCTVGETVAILATIRSVKPPEQRGGMLRSSVSDRNGVRLSCRWFNAGYLARKLKAGSTVIVHGKLETWQPHPGQINYGMTNPLIEPVDVGSAGKLIGMYPASAKHDLTSWTLYNAAREAVSRLGALIDPIPHHLTAAHNLPSRADAFRMVHDPDSTDATRAGRDRLAYDELLRLQLVLATSKAATKAETAYAHDVPGALLNQFCTGLPFALTGAQTRAIDEIVTDMAAAEPMFRLLQGDVGAGKTAVAIAAMLIAVEAGRQAVLIAPTEILASQHFEDIAAQVGRIVKADGNQVHVALLTNKVTGAERKRVLAGLADATIDIAVGTHALLTDVVTFANLSCVVIDEQHRFGVEQRNALRTKAGGRTPDVLYASATPIPRTAAMTVFGDLDVSTLDEMPPGRTPVVTRHVVDASPNDRNAEPWKAIRAGVAAGRQAFVVTPLVSTSLTQEDAAAHATADDLSSGALAGLRIGVVTGKDKPADRKETMADFAAGNLDVLVATTVIEVGVNIPNATVMVVLGADRFGLAQLHQLRGRVGRGSHPGVCWLVADPKTSAGQDRMEAMTSTTDGFVLAELDLAIRGAGKITGVSQSGTGRDLKVANIMTDTELIAWARADAAAITSNDPHLARAPMLQAEIVRAVGPDGAQWLQAA